MIFFIIFFTTLRAFFVSLFHAVTAFAFAIFASPFRCRFFFIAAFDFHASFITDTDDAARLLSPLAAISQLAARCRQLFRH